MTTKPSCECDVRVENHGSLFVFWPLTDKATAWVEENVEVPDYMRLGGTDGFTVEHGYAREIAQGMLDAGLEVK